VYLSQIRGYLFVALHFTIFSMVLALFMCFLCGEGNMQYD
jgi:hypothetical protein